MSRLTLLIFTVACSGRTAGPKNLPLEEARTALQALAPSESLRPVSAFSGIEDSTTRSAALFLEMGKVFTHPRCTNCHPSSDRPLQGETMQPHMPPVQRGADGHGTATLACSTCHGTEHAVFVTGEGSVPGNPHWALAPREMAWEGVSIGSICEQVRDPARNGGKSLEELVTHNAEDGLVGYAWDPGPGREPAPGSQALFGALTRAWVDSGAACPTPE